MRRRLAACLLLLPLQVLAEAEPDWAAAFRAYLATPAYVNALGRELALVERRLAPECVRRLAGVERVELRIRETPGFAGSTQQPDSGQWHERVAVERCGARVLHNLLVTAHSNGPPRVTVLLPGTSKAGAEMQLAARQAVMAVAGARRGQACPAGRRDIVDAAFDRYLGLSGDAALAERIWREVWTVRLCGETVVVEVRFVPDGKGGFIHAVDLAE